MLSQLKVTAVLCTNTMYHDTLQQLFTHVTHSHYLTETGHGYETIFAMAPKLSPAVCCVVSASHPRHRLRRGINCSLDVNMTIYN